MAVATTKSTLQLPSTVSQRGVLRGLAALGLAIGGAFLLLRLGHVSMRDLRGALEALTPASLGIMVLGYIVLNVCQAVRYREVQRPLAKLSLRDALDVRFTSSFLNNVLPARGGDLFRIDRVARLAGVPRATVVGSELHDFWIDKVGWLPAIALLSLIEPVAPWMLNVIWSISGLFAFALVVTVLLARLPDALMTRAPRLVRSVHASFTNRSVTRLIVIALLVAPVTWLVETATIYLSARAAGMSVSLIDAFTVLSAINIAAVVPTPANGGAFEAGGGAALIAAHVPAAMATAFILVFHVCQIVVSALIGGAWLGLSRKPATPPPATLPIARPQPTNGITVRPMRDDDAASWDALVNASAAATIYNSRAWKEIAERGYGMRTQFLVATRNDVVVGVLPLFRVPRPMQPYLTSGIFGAYGPIIASDPAAEAALVHQARELAETMQLDHLHLKVFGASAIAAEQLQPLHIWSVALLDLEETAAAQFAKLTGGMRNKIRKAEKFGFEVRRGHAELKAFYDVLAENMHRKGSPIYGLHFMKSMLAAFGDTCDVVTLYENGRAVSGALIVWFNGTMYVPFASSRVDAFAKRVNYLLFWTLIETAIANGLKRFDFGTSMQGASTLEFKLQWGTTLHPVTSYFFKANGELPNAAPTGAGIRLFMRAWSSAPRALVDRLGPHIIPWTA